jgi:hypothetical protein
MENVAAISRVWFDALFGSPELEAFCQDRFNAGLTVLLGVPEEDKAGQDIAPYIAIVPLTDNGGFEAEQDESTLCLDLGIYDAQRQRVGATSEILRGVESLGLFFSAVCQVLGETEYPPSRWEAETPTSIQNFFEAVCFFHVDRTRTI